MDNALLRFVALLRAAGVRVSTGETVDAMRAAAVTQLRDRATLKTVLGLTLVKDSRDEPIFSDLFDRFFRLAPLDVHDDDGHDPTGHEHLRDESPVRQVTVSAEPAPTPAQGHTHGTPADIRDFFKERDLASRYNVHQPAEKLDIGSVSEQLVVSSDQRRGTGDGQWAQLETDRLHDAGMPGDLAAVTGTHVDVDLSVVPVGQRPDADLPAEVDAALRRRVSAILAELPALLKAHLETLARQNRALEYAQDPLTAVSGTASERDRRVIEEALRRLARQLHGALTHRKCVARVGRVDLARTIRRNLGHDAVPFRRVLVGRNQDRPRLVVLADVSLSVRSAAWFTLLFVHGLQRLFPRVRTFAFVDELVEVTELFEELDLEGAMRRLFGGEALNVDGNSDYGKALGRFATDHLGAVTARTSVVVLGDGRGNGNDPNLPAFTEIVQRARRVVWLTPEPRYSWSLGRCDLPLYAELCGHVHVVRDAAGLDAVAAELGHAVATTRG